MIWLSRKSTILIALLLGCQTSPGSEPVATSGNVEQSATTPLSRMDEPGIDPRWRDGYRDRQRRFNSLAERGEIDLVFAGDSITHNWEVNAKDVWSYYYGERKAVNFGMGADRTQHMLWRIDDGNFDGAIDPKLVVLQIGTNNASVDTPQETADGVVAVVHKIRQKLPETKILLLAIFPRGSAIRDRGRQVAMAANNLIKSAIEDPFVHYLDIGETFTREDGSISKEVMGDSIHLTRLGYRMWAEAIEPKVSELLEEETAIPPMEGESTPEFLANSADISISDNYKDATFVASPNPIRICDDSGVGITTLSWTSTGPTAVELRFGSPSGRLFGRMGPQGQVTTGRWVGDRMLVYLQDVSDGKPLTPENTIGRVQIRLTDEGCP